MSIVEISTLVVSFLLAASRLLDFAKPWWNKLPPVVVNVLPAVVMMLPQVASYFGVVKTEMDLVMACVLSVALLLPGLTAKQ